MLLSVICEYYEYWFYFSYTSLISTLRVMKNRVNDRMADVRQYEQLVPANFVLNRYKK